MAKKATSASQRNRKTSARSKSPKKEKVCATDGLDAPTPVQKQEKRESHFAWRLPASLRTLWAQTEKPAYSLLQQVSTQALHLTMAFPDVKLFWITVPRDVVERDCPVIEVWKNAERLVGDRNVVQIFSQFIDPYGFGFVPCNFQPVGENVWFPFLRNGTQAAAACLDELAHNTIAALSDDLLASVASIWRDLENRPDYFACWNLMAIVLCHDQWIGDNSIHELDADLPDGWGQHQLRESPFRLAARICDTFIMHGSGRGDATTWWQQRFGENEVFDRLDEDLSTARSRPVWNRDSKTLVFRKGKTLYTKAARNQFEILDEFERHGWPEEIKTPQRLLDSGGKKGVQNAVSFANKKIAGSGIKLQLSNGSRTISWNSINENPVE